MNRLSSDSDKFKSSKLKNKTVLILATILGTVAYWRLFTFSILSYADWGFHYARELKEFLIVSVWQQTHNLGNVNDTLWHAPVNFLYGIFGYFNFSSSVADVFLVFLPLAVLPVTGSYLLFKKIAKSNLAALCGALVFSFNTYYLAINTQGHTFLVLAGGLATYALLFLIRLFKSGKLIDGMAFGILLSLVGYLDFRIAYIVIIISAFYAGYALLISKSEIKRQILFTFLAGIGIFVLANLFWLVPAKYSGGLLNNQILNRSLFGSEFWNLRSAIALNHPFWNGGKPEWFIVTKTPFYAWIIPILAFLGVLLNRKNHKVLFWSLVSFAGILLAKQENQPFPTLYIWLFRYLPGFNAFRESTKFYFLIALGYGVLITFLTKYLINNRSEKYAKYVPLIIVAIISAINLIPQVTGSIKSLYEPRTIPVDYKQEAKLNSNQNYYRTFWAPIPSRWGVVSANHPQLSASVVDSEWSDFIPQNIKQDDSQYKQRVQQLLDKDIGKQFFVDSSMKYAFVPIQDVGNDGDFFKFYGNDRQFYVDSLDSVPWLKRVDIGAKELAVYENENYKPYLSSFTNLTNVNSTGNIDSVYNFAVNELGQKDFQFQVKKEKNKSNEASINDLFADLKRSELKSTGIERTFQTNGQQALSMYANNNRPVINYHIQNDTLTFEAQKLAGPFVQQTNSNLVQGTNSGISSAPLEDGEYFVNIEKDMLAVDRKKPDRSLGVVKTAPVLMKADSQNLIPNPSLEDGLWQKKVDDCNNYDGNAQINQRIDPNFWTNGKQSLLLEADKHTACTGPNEIPVMPGGQYLLNFDYRVLGGRQAGYEIQYVGSKTKPRKEYLYVNDNNWRQVSTLVTVPQDATAIKILAKGFPDDRNKQHAVTHYDNFRLSKVNTVLNTNLDVNPQYTKTDLSPRSEVKISYQNLSLKYENMIANGSLEQGLWQKQVGDCNAFDDNPKINMKLSDEHSDGSKSLQLEAKRHIACTGPNKVPVRENGKYLLSFDYQSPNAENAGYYVAFNDPARTTTSEVLPIKDSKWQNFTKTITAPYSATNMQVIVYAYSTELGNVNVINRYDNFYLAEVPDIADQYYLTAAPKTELKQPAKVSFELDSPTKKTIHVKNADTPFYLAMSEAYHPQWRLVFNNANVHGLASWVPWAKPNVVPADDHIKLNDFQNGWYIDTEKLCAEQALCTRNPDGSFNLELIAEFAPQRWFYVGLIISGTTLVGCISYLIISAIKKQRGQDSVYKTWKK